MTPLAEEEDEHATHHSEAAGCLPSTRKPHSRKNSRSSSISCLPGCISLNLRRYQAEHNRAQKSLASRSSTSELSKGLSPASLRKRSEFFRSTFFVTPATTDIGLARITPQIGGLLTQGQFRNVKGQDDVPVEVMDPPFYIDGSAEFVPGPEAAFTGVILDLIYRLDSGNDERFLVAARRQIPASRQPCLRKRIRSNKRLPARHAGHV